jgi:hypothetical protein
VRIYRKTAYAVCSRKKLDPVKFRRKKSFVTIGLLHRRLSGNTGMMSRFMKNVTRRAKPAVGPADSASSSRILSLKESNAVN